MWEQGCKFIQDSFLIARFQYKEFRYSEVRLYARRGGSIGETNVGAYMWC